MAARAKKKRLCHNDCGRPVSDGNLYCSTACAEQFATRRRDAKRYLLAAGFSQDPEALNTFTKDGVAVTIQECVKHGSEETVNKARPLAGG